jgi:threonyl-tRNA synthetase
VAQYNYILVVGRDEQVRGTVNVRTRDNVVHGEKTLAELTRQLKNDIAAYR